MKAQRPTGVAFRNALPKRIDDRTAVLQAAIQQQIGALGFRQQACVHRHAESARGNAQIFHHRAERQQRQQALVALRSQHQILGGEYPDAIVVDREANSVVVVGRGRLDRALEDATDIVIGHASHFSASPTDGGQWRWRYG